MTSPAPQRVNGDRLPPGAVRLAESYEPPNGTVNTAQIRFVFEALTTLPGQPGLPSTDPWILSGGVSGIAYVESLVELAIEHGTLDREQTLGALVLCKIAGNHFRCMLTDIGALEAPFNPEDN